MLGMVSAGKLVTSQQAVSCYRDGSPGQVTLILAHESKGLGVGAGVGFSVGVGVGTGVGVGLGVGVGVGADW
jgi:hypothetical protein